MSFFNEARQIPPDSLLQLIADFRNDPSPNKIDLGVGVYQDDSGRTPIFSAVATAQQRLLQIEDTKSYLGPLGWPGFDNDLKQLILGEQLNSQLGARVAALPTPGSSGALKSAGTLVKRINPEARIWLSRPSWANHRPIFISCGFEPLDYTYYDQEAAGIDRSRMYEDLAEVRAGDVVVVHGCCHNPTGADFVAEDWAFVTAMACERGIIPLVDIAYQGLGDGFEDDLAATRAMLAEVPDAILCYSFSKNMGLYRERVGGTLVLSENAEAAGRVQSNLNEIARRTYSMPPSYGAALASIVLRDPVLNRNWRDELEEMRQRVSGLRSAVADALAERFGDNRFRYIREQRGMFSQLPLTPAQIERFKTEASIYMAPDGRINLCGFTPAKIERFAAVMEEIVAD